MSKPKVRLRQATVEDVPALLTLLNQSYRHNVGWTNEAHLVSGIRTTAAEIEAMITNPKHYLFVYPDVFIDAQTDKAQETGKVLACISVEIKTNDFKNDDSNETISAYDSAYIGTFAVDPMLQGKGIGNEVLSAAETFAVRHLNGVVNSAKKNNDKQKNADNESTSHQNLAHLKMSVLERRPELLAYYQRRGYELTGNSQPFPVDGNNGEPKFDDLKLLELEKWVQINPDTKTDYQATLS